MSHHFPPKVVPSWLHAGFERLSVCIGYNKKKIDQKHEDESVLFKKIFIFLLDWKLTINSVSTGPTFFSCTVTLILTPDLCMACIALTVPTHTDTKRTT